VARHYALVAPFIDAELARRGEERFWERIAREHRGQRVLELGAGTGRVTVILARFAGAVVAIDLSADMLDRARARLARLRHVTLRVADMRTLALEERFDLVVAANDPFSHLVEDEDRAWAMETAARHLVPGGELVLDALRLPGGEAAAARGGEERERVRAVSLGGQSLLVRERWRCDRVSRRCEARYEYQMAGQTLVTSTFPARYWSMTELEVRCARAGLAITRCWGSYEGDRWDEQTARCLIVVARKR
jgi:SAM-dependent methyltransferase